MASSVVSHRSLHHSLHHTVHPVPLHPPHPSGSITHARSVPHRYMIDESSLPNLLLLRGKHLINREPNIQMPGTRLIFHCSNIIQFFRNGRLARALTDMALAQDEKLTARFYSISCWRSSGYSHHSDPLEANRRHSHLDPELALGSGPSHRGVQGGQLGLQPLCRRMRDQGEKGR